MNRDRGFWRADLWRRAHRAGAAAPSDEMAPGSRRTRSRRGATTPLVERKPSDGEGADRPASRVSDEPDPLYVDTSQQARRSSRPTFAEAAVERGVAQ
jgi:hypothetical protein